MKYLVILFFLVPALYGQCPLGFAPDEACGADAPSCALFTDSNGDNLCDNAALPGQSTEEEPEEAVEPELEPEEPEIFEEAAAEVVVEEEVVIDPFCPLDLSPQDACSQENARCTFYTDSNGDNLCDNAGSQPAPSAEEIVEEPEVEEEQPEPQIDPVEEEIVEEPEVEEEVSPETDTVEVLHTDCPLGFTVEEACQSDDPLCTLFRDLDENQICDNGIVTAVEDTSNGDEVSTSHREGCCPFGYTTDQACTSENAECACYLDWDENQICDNGIVTAVEDTSNGDEASTSHRERCCPFGYTTDQACTFENAECACYLDLDENGFCDNPAQGGDATEYPAVVGCPMGLPPVAACSDSLALCPHWYGVSSHTTCSNPSGGQRRINIILITLGVLLPISTWLSRRFYGRRMKDRLRRNTAHHIVRGVSLMILGFGVQGCFCPLGTFQYAFTAGGLAFLGLTGVLIFALPLVFSAFFGRVFCGWVCPFGALQEFLYRIHVPGRFSPSGKVHHRLKHLSKVILFALVAAILLNRFGVISLQWPAPFCNIDPFHTIFTLFLSGSLVVAGVTIILAIFIRRFFCKYLCFYGAAQAIMAKLTLWNRIKGIKRAEPELDSDEEFDK